MFRTPIFNKTAKITPQNRKKNLRYFIPPHPFHIDPRLCALNEGGVAGKETLFAELLSLFTISTSNFALIVLNGSMLC